MTQRFLLMVRFSPAGADVVARSGLTSYVEQLAERLASPPGNATIEASYGTEDHDWDLIVVGAAADLPGYWAAGQLRSRIGGLTTATKLIPLTPLAEVDEHLTVGT